MLSFFQSPTIWKLFYHFVIFFNPMRFENYFHFVLFFFSIPNNLKNIFNLTILSFFQSPTIRKLFYHLVLFFQSHTIWKLFLFCFVLFSIPNNLKTIFNLTILPFFQSHTNWKLFFHFILFFFLSPINLKTISTWPFTFLSSCSILYNLKNIFSLTICSCMFRSHSKKRNGWEILNFHSFLCSRLILYTNFNADISKTQNMILGEINSLSEVAGRGRKNKFRPNLWPRAVYIKYQFVNVPCCHPSGLHVV